MVDRVVTTEVLIAKGYTPRRIATRTSRGEWIRIHRGVILLARNIEQEDLEAAALLVGGPRAVLSHVSGARHHRLAGVDGLPGFWTPDGDVYLTIPRSQPAPARPGLRVYRSDLKAGEGVGNSWIRVTSLERTLVDIAQTFPVELAVVMFDQALHSGFTTRQEIESHIRSKGSRRVRQVLSLARPEAESPLETLSRLKFAEHGLVADALQEKIFDADGRFLGRPDFTFRGARGCVLGEADGVAVHSGDVMRAKDSVREELLRRAGYQVVRWTWAQLAKDPAQVVARIRAFM